MVGRIRTVVFIAAASLVLGGCGGGSTTVVQGIRVLKIIDVHETEYALSPKSIHIKRFGYYGIKAVNDGTAAHALAVEGHGIDKKTANVAPGKSATLLVFFRKAGKYTLYCPIDGHEQKGMKATVKVH